VIPRFCKHLSFGKKKAKNTVKVTNRKFVFVGFFWGKSKPHDLLFHSISNRLIEYIYVMKIANVSHFNGKSMILVLVKS